MEGKYAVKCDECKAEIARTDSLHVSACGGLCETCESEPWEAPMMSTYATEPGEDDGDESWGPPVDHSQADYARDAV